MTEKDENYFRFEIEKALRVDKKQGPQRDPGRLNNMVLVLFRQRAQNLTIYNLLPILRTKYGDLKKDTLEDNLEWLSKMPADEPLIKIEPEVTGKRGKPRNIYKVSDHYITDFYKIPHDLGLPTNADVRCTDPMDPTQCTNPECKVCLKAGMKSWLNQEKD